MLRCYQLVSSIFIFIVLESQGAPQLVPWLPTIKFDRTNTSAEWRMSLPALGFDIGAEMSWGNGKGQLNEVTGELDEAMSTDRTENIEVSTTIDQVEETKPVDEDPENFDEVPTTTSSDIFEDSVAVQDEEPEPTNEFSDNSDMIMCTAIVNNFEASTTAFQINDSETLYEDTGVAEEVLSATNADNFEESTAVDQNKVFNDEYTEMNTFDENTEIEDEIIPTTNTDFVESSTTVPQDVENQPIDDVPEEWGKVISTTGTDNRDSTTAHQVVENEPIDKVSERSDKVTTAMNIIEDNTNAYQLEETGSPDVASTKAGDIISTTNTDIIEDDTTVYADEETVSRRDVTEIIEDT